ncbi:hypothetical protein DFJ74DRAFT_712552 [Hyaloraphidium curvatum]|nr:hypothetical protein DFJ74DRAFT_712552 [Hyaloraphidium curvatum]
MRAPALLLLALALLAGAAPARAHVSASPNIGVKGSYLAFALRVPHGCEGQNTLAVTAVIPFNVTSVKPRRTPGWAVSTTLRPLVPPVTDADGNTVNTTIDTVTWTAITAGDELPDTQYDDFGLQVRLPTAAANNTLYFPTFQNCTAGLTAAWDGAEAPKVTLVDSLTTTARPSSAGAVSSGWALLGAAAAWALL